MVQAANEHGGAPRVEMRQASSGLEEYVPGSGLAVWEIAWIAALYERDIDATMTHLGQSRDVIEEGHRYTGEHAKEIDVEIEYHTARTLEELREMLPRMRVVNVDFGEPD